MSEDSKPKTMIGTVAPITRPPTLGPGSQPAAGAPPAPRPPAGSVPPPETAPAPADPQATAWLRPQAKPQGTLTPAGAPPAPRASTAPPVATPGPATGAHAAPAPYVAGPPSMPALSYGTEHAAPFATSAPTSGMAPGHAQALAAAAAAPELAAGQELAGYVIRRKLAEGGMGVVYEAQHGKIGRIGAIKVLRRELCQSEEVIERFYQEARAVNSIRHENIVDIYDFGRDEHGRAFFVMEYLEGEPLSARLRRGPMPWAEAFPVLDQTLRALKAAHDKGFVHRDLKPDNIWLRASEGKISVKLLDFGIAKLVGAESPRDKLTQTGSVIGTPHYMSPEQINGARDIDQRTDLYAMGIIMYEMFTGVTPFGGDTLQAVLTGHLFTQAPRLADLPPMLGVPGPVAEIVERALAKEPASRYDSAAQILADLHDINRHQRPSHASSLHHTRPLQQQTGPRLPGAQTAPGAGSPPSAAPMPQVAPARRRPVALLAAGALVLGGAAAAAVVVPRLGKPAAPAASHRGGDEKPTPAPANVVTEKGPDKPPALDRERARSESLSTLRGSLDEAEPAVRIDGANAAALVRDDGSRPRLGELTEKDDDRVVRGTAAIALAKLGADDKVPLLASLEGSAPAPLRVWYTAALARLGDGKAYQRLLKAAGDKDLAIASFACATLAELAKPGDKKALAALQKLTKREAELTQGDVLAGVTLLGNLAALRDAKAHQLLVGVLAAPQDNLQLAAAERLARLGDDSGREVLKAAADKPGSQNQLPAAAAQVLLGEYSGLDVLTKGLDDLVEARRILAARALGQIGQEQSLPVLLPLIRPSEKSWRVRVAAAAAVVQIVGLDPKVLAQASVDWMLASLAATSDLATRQAAAGVLSDLPVKDAVPLLATAIADEDTSVRRIATRAARKLKTPDAARTVVAALSKEKDPEVREEQVLALGDMGQKEALPALVELSSEPGRVGVLAAGSRIAVGDPSAAGKLEAAVAPAQELPLRLAAVQAAAVARQPVVLPTLRIGAQDRAFEVQLGAAEGLSLLGAEKAVAVPILSTAMKARDTATVTRALVALTRFGEAPAAGARSPEELVASLDPALRLAAVPVVQEMPLAQGMPLLRRLLTDPDAQVRRASADAVAAVVPKDKDAAIKLYKPLVTDRDDVVRAKAAGQLAKLLPPVVEQPVVTQQQQPDAGAAPQPDAGAAQLSPAVLEALTATRAAADEARRAAEALDKVANELAATVAAGAKDDDADDKAEKLKRALDDARARVLAASDAAAAAAAEVTGAGAAADSAEAKEAAALAESARKEAASATAKAKEAEKKADELITSSSVDLPRLVSSAARLVKSGNLGGARKLLDQASKDIRRSKDKELVADYYQTVGALQQALADAAGEPAAKRKALEAARAAYQQVTKSGFFTANAQKQLQYIQGDLDALGPP